MNLPSSYEKSLSISIPSERSWRRLSVTDADFDDDGTKSVLPADAVCLEYMVCGLTGAGLCDKMIEVMKKETEAEMQEEK